MRRRHRSRPDPLACALRMLTYARCCVISRSTTSDDRPGSGQWPCQCQLATHIKEARQGPRVYVRTYMVLRCAPGLPSWSMFRRGSFSHMCLPFQFSILMCGALFPSCWGGRPGGYVAGWWLALYATMVYGWMGVSDCRCLPACLLASQPARARRRDERACMI